MDYQMLLTQGEQEWNRAMEGLDKRLEKMTQVSTMKTQAELSQSINDIQKFIPLGIYVI